MEMVNTRNQSREASFASNGGGKPQNQGWIIAALGWLTMTIGLFLGTVAGQTATKMGASVEVTRLVQAIVVSSIVLPAVMGICRTFKLKNSFLSMSGRGALHFGGAIALAVILTSLGLWLSSLAGWIELTGWSMSSAQVLALLLQIATALLYEALPEELTLRGLVFSGLSMRIHAAAVFIGSIFLFVMVPVATIALQVLVGMAPGNSIDFGYVLLLVLFGSALQLLRMITGALWASVGFHLAYLMIARFIFGREDRFLSYTENLPGVSALIILFLLIGSCMVLALLNGRHARARRRDKGIQG